MPAGSTPVSADLAGELVVCPDASGGEWGVSDGAGWGTAFGAAEVAVGLNVGNLRLRWHPSPRPSPLQGARVVLVCEMFHTDGWLGVHDGIEDGSGKDWEGERPRKGIRGPKVETEQAGMPAIRPARRGRCV